MPPVLLHDNLQEELPDKTTVDDLLSLLRRSSRFHESSPGMFALTPDSGQHDSDIPRLPISSGTQLEQMLHESPPLTRDEQTVLFKQLAGIQHLLSSGSSSDDISATEAIVQNLSLWARCNRGWSPQEIYRFAVGHDTVPILSKKLEKSVINDWDSKTHVLLSAVSALEWIHRDLVYDVATFHQQLVDKLTISNCRLVASQVKGWAQGGFLMYVDLFQEGVIGLLKAIHRFNPYRGHQFSTYAVHWIRQAVTRAIADQERTIRVPVHMYEQINRLTRANNHLSQKLGREPTIDELAEELKILSNKVEHVIRISKQLPLNLDEPVNEEEDSVLGDFIPDEDIGDPLNFANKTILQDMFKGIAQDLTPREIHTLQLRFGIVDGNAYTLEEIGKKFGVTRERVRQIETQALVQMRQSNRRESLDWYF